jgi:hypothetical protein
VDATTKTAGEPVIFVSFYCSYFQVKSREVGLIPNTEAMLYLDYGTIYDSTGKHVDMWVTTIVSRDLENNIHRQHVVLFYTKDRPKGETNKNANTGMMCLRELVLSELK